MAGCDLLSFLDAYSGYHQIKLDPADRLKNAFITPFGVFCYISMTFSLRNTGATFQRCDKLKYTLQIHFAASNNVAEYEAVIHGLRLAKEIGIRRILYYSDSDLVVQQSSSNWDTKDANMASYRFLVQQISRHFDGCEFIHVPRANNEEVDALARIGSTQQAILVGFSLECLRKPSIQPPPESESIFMPADPRVAISSLGTSAACPGTSAGGSGAATPKPGPRIPEPDPGTSTMQQGADGSNPLPPNPATPTPVAVTTVVEAPSWAQPILNFLVSRELPADEVLSRQVQHQAAVYTIINRELVRRSTTSVFQRCVEPEKGIAILRGIHQGECGHHAASRALVAKAFRHGFFWPTALDDAKELVRKYKGCQRFSTKQHLPALALKTIPITWPFAVWGLDMVGPFKTTRGGMTHILFVVDKFTKWIEARPIKKLNGPTAITFITDITI
ncbi:uncharacterized protein [Aegilops tauschii subsp. strangulata]|uniref:uncharacterized protein n=1 Tax=Aegilops tauschii subsp. strangulata TaxID=200361 RepID=UPI003CC880F1